MTDRIKEKFPLLLLEHLFWFSTPMIALGSPVEACGLSLGFKYYNKKESTVSVSSDGVNQTIRYMPMMQKY